MRKSFTAPRMVAASLALVACGATTPGPAQRPILADDRVYTSDAPAATTAMLDAPANRVWFALESTYRNLGIDVTTQDIPSHTIGNRDFWKMHQLNSVRLSRLVDCGNGQTGPKADSYRIYFSVLSTVAAQADGKTKVETQVVPTGLDVSGTSSDRIPCGSTGELERLINEGARKLLTN